MNRPVSPFSALLKGVPLNPVIGLAAALLAQGVLAATPGAMKSFDIVRITEAEAPKIDGRLDDAAWQKAVKIDEFSQFLPNEGQPESVPTVFYVMYDKDAIYIGARLSEPCLLYTSPSPRDRTRSRMPSSA